MDSNETGLTKIEKPISHSENSDVAVNFRSQKTESDSPGHQIKKALDVFMRTIDDFRDALTRSSRPHRDSD